MPGIITLWLWSIDSDMPMSEEYLMGKDRIVERWDKQVGNEESEKVKLSRMISLNPPLVDDTSVKYVGGTVYFQDAVREVYYDIDIGDDSKGVLKSKRDIRIRTYNYSFWASFRSDLKLVCFSNSKINLDSISHLSNILFNNPRVLKSVEFDIEKIEEDTYNQENIHIIGSWTQSFNGRNGSINKGVVYSDTIIQNSDPIYNEISHATKNSIGLVISYDDEEFKVKITRKGIVQIYKNYNLSDDLPKIFDIISIFKDYII